MLISQVTSHWKDIQTSSSDKHITDFLGLPHFLRRLYQIVLPCFATFNICGHILAKHNRSPELNRKPLTSNKHTFPNAYTALVKYRHK